MKEVDPEELNALTERFKALGAKDPENWAISQLRHGTNQIANYSLLKWIWDKCIVDEDDVRWIERLISYPFNPNVSQSQLGEGLRQMKRAGVSDEAVLDVVRCAQFEAVQSLLIFLEGSAAHNLPCEIGMFELVDTPGGPIAGKDVGCYEMLLATDPKNREMRPRPSRET